MLNRIFGGLVEEMAPNMAKGALLEILSQRGISVATVTNWVQTGYSIYDSLKPAEQEGLMSLAKRVKDVSWLTTDWVINALRRDYQAVASLFLGWDEARIWLDGQIKEIKEKGGLA